MKNITAITIAAISFIVVCFLEVYLLDIVRDYTTTHPGISKESQDFLCVAWFTVAFMVIPTLWFTTMAGLFGQEDKNSSKLKLC